MRLILILFILFSFVNAELPAELKEMVDNAKSKYSKILTQNREYYSYLIEENKKYYSKLIAREWGEENVKFSEIKTFTTYSKDLKSRETIDFENAKVVIESTKELPPKEFEYKLKLLKNETIKEAKERDPLLNKIPKKENTQKFFKDLIQDKKITKSDIKEKTIANKKILSVEVPMVDDYLMVLAKKYEKDVIKQAKRFNISPSYIYSTIQTESSFNPFAISPAGAYGLMQIVPKSAGVDAYYGLYGEKKILSPEYLYEPTNNIEIGSKYIEIIQNRYLSGIKNKNSLDYCTAISYNAGIGNLYRAFGKKSKKEAIKEVNLLTAKEVFDKLKTSKKLIDEANNYIRKIVKNRKNYISFDKK